MKKFLGYGTLLLIVTETLLGYNFCDYGAYIRDHFPRAQAVCVDVAAVQARNVRKIPVRRDGLMTDEIARVLYRSNDVIEYYERLRSECSGDAVDQMQKHIELQQEYNREHAMFFVSIYGSRRDWAFTICKDGHVYKAIEVRHADLDRNYKHIFGKEAFRYQQNIYQVVFDVTLDKPFEFILCNGAYKASATFE